MTNEETKMILEMGPYYHVTGRRLQRSIEQSGLDPQRGEDTFQDRGEPRLCFCPAKDRQETIDYLQDKHPGDSELLIISVAADTMIKKRLGPDSSWQGGIGNIADSLRKGILCCFDLIRAEEFAGIEIISNQCRLKDDAVCED
jgi:hypothetical protein